MLREYLGKPSPCPDKGESDGAAAEPTDVTTVQVPAEPQGQPQPAAVAPMETKKYKDHRTIYGTKYAIFIATIHPDNNQETVGSVANKLRNYESIISGPVQAQVSAVVKELREEMREMREEMKRNSSHVAPVRVTSPRVRAQWPPARGRRYTPRADLWFFLRDHGEDKRRWDGKPTSALAAWVRELKERNINRGGSTKMKLQHPMTKLPGIIEVRICQIPVTEPLPCVARKGIVTSARGTLPLARERHGENRVYWTV
ncbi:hypothetical protein DUI87_26348 [Hirundo rustica rustica]|uniref:Uncharacterized protein n=1 Tax=Hirundo rustica rustica TaxID=333673 RepID=A0A3M0J838_HIRRU|nr:hypothetical protein DUI87_26348 [Hirundo rustica rustica]